jgi:hypothetical protein
MVALLDAKLHVHGVLTERDLLRQHPGIIAQAKYVAFYHSHYLSLTNYISSI